MSCTYSERLMYVQFTSCGKERLIDTKCVIQTKRQTNSMQHQAATTELQTSIKIYIEDIINDLMV